MWHLGYQYCLDSDLDIKQEITILRLGSQSDLAIFCDAVVCGWKDVDFCQDWKEAAYCHNIDMGCRTFSPVQAVISIEYWLGALGLELIVNSESHRKAEIRLSILNTDQTRDSSSSTEQDCNRTKRFQTQSVIFDKDHFSIIYLLIHWYFYIW